MLIWTLSLAELLNLFVSEVSAAMRLSEVRWAEGIRCPYCSSETVIGWAWYRDVYQRYLCKVCRRMFPPNPWLRTWKGKPFDRRIILLGNILPTIVRIGHPS